MLAALTGAFDAAISAGEVECLFVGDVHLLGQAQQCPCDSSASFLHPDLEGRVVDLGSVL